MSPLKKKHPQIVNGFPKGWVQVAHLPLFPPGKVNLKGVTPCLVGGVSYYWIIVQTSQRKRMDLIAKPDLDFKVKLKLSLSTIKKDTSKLKPLLKLIKDLER